MTQKKGKKESDIIFQWRIFRIVCKKSVLHISYILVSFINIMIKCIPFNYILAVDCSSNDRAGVK